MTAAAHGQLLNLSRLGQSLAPSHTTVGSYLDYLEGAFLVRRLRPYAANLKERLVRSPKLYWRDSGLLHAPLRVRTYDDLLVQPWVGASWEGYVIEQVLATLAATGPRADPHFFRTSDGYGVDLLRAHKRILVSQVRRPAISERRVSCDIVALLAQLRERAGTGR